MLFGTDMTPKTIFIRQEILAHRGQICQELYIHNIFIQMNKARYSNEHLARVRLIFLVPSLFHRHRFCQIPWLVGIATELDRHMVGEKLERNHS